jgi:hypothetical protein
MYYKEEKKRQEKKTGFSHTHILLGVQYANLMLNKITGSAQQFPHKAGLLFIDW